MIVVLFWFSLFSFASYRMQRECIPRYNIGARHHLKIPKGVRFLFVHLGNKRRYLTAAVVLQCVAYLYLLVCLFLDLRMRTPEFLSSIDRWSKVLLLLIAVYVCAVDFFYRIDSKRHRM